MNHTSGTHNIHADDVEKRNEEGTLSPGCGLIGKPFGEPVNEPFGEPDGRSQTPARWIGAFSIRVTPV